METSSDQVVAILWELRFIRWLLLFLVLIGFGFLVSIVRFSRSAGGLTEALDKEQRNKNRQNELEGLLSQGAAKEAKFAAIEWVAAQPKQPYAHWFLARAHYQLGEFVHAKKEFQMVNSVSPDWESVIQPWLEKVDAEIKSGPKIVN